MDLFLFTWAVKNREIRLNRIEIMLESFYNFFHSHSYIKKENFLLLRVQRISIEVRKQRNEPNFEEKKITNFIYLFFLLYV
jgi:hypothetical protein